MNTILAKVKLALRITTTDFDDQLKDLVNAAILDLGIAGITADSLIVITTNSATYDDLFFRAIVTYCRLNFGDLSVELYDRLKASYDEQKAQMQMATGYTNWL